MVLVARGSSARRALAARALALLCASTLALVAACAGVSRFDEAGPWPPPKSGMVVCEHALASDAGVAILERGGNAADAAVAVALALAVVYPQAGNLGGGGFAVWVAHDPALAPLFLDFRETAPRALTAQLFLDENGQRVAARSVAGGLGVAVPGSPRGLYDFQRKLGRLSFAEVVAPAIELARKGFVVDRFLAKELGEERAKLLAHPGAAALFFPGGECLREGQRLVQPELVRTLTRYAHEGPDGFYRGEVAAALVAEAHAEGGVLAAEDLAHYEAKWRAPLTGWFRGLEIVTAPPPSSGGVALLQVLALLDGFPLDEERVRVNAEEQASAERASADRANAEQANAEQANAEQANAEQASSSGLSPRALHWWIESMRLAFADRAEHLGDPDFHAVPVATLLSPERINELRVGIGELANPLVHTLPVAAAGPAREGQQTTHISVLDVQGNAVSLTTTLNTNFGSGILARGAGVLLNDEIDDFAIVAGSPNVYGLVGGTANALAPDKRPLSSMTPVVVRDGGKVVKLVLGSPGGPRIITSVLEVILRTVVYGEDLATAVAAPRVHQQWSPSATVLEPGWNELLVQGLKDRNHVIEIDPEPWGSVQAIAVEVGGDPLGVSDPRSGGKAARARNPKDL